MISMNGLQKMKTVLFGVINLSLKNIHKIKTKDGLYMVGVILLALEMFSKKKYLIFYHGKMRNQLILKNF